MVIDVGSNFVRDIDTWYICCSEYISLIDNENVLSTIMFYFKSLEHIKKKERLTHILTQLKTFTIEKTIK